MFTSICYMNVVIIFNVCMYVFMCLLILESEREGEGERET